MKQQRELEKKVKAKTAKDARQQMIENARGRVMNYARREEGSKSGDRGNNRRDRSSEYDASPQ